MSRTLDVYLYNELAGKFHQDKSGQLLFTYNPSYVDQDKPSLSLSLPLRTKTFEGKVVRAFFSGVLPEEDVRRRLARYLGVSEQNPFSLLKIIGGDCAGALSLYPEGTEPPENISGYIETLDDKRLQEILELIKRRPFLAGEDKIRLSLAGAQDKLPVGFKDGQVLLISGTAPTTHIIKPLISNIDESVQNELFCMRLAKHVGIDVPHAAIHTVGSTPYYIVGRYDRTINEDGSVMRLHQEDFCQALGILPEAKYESEGGPSLVKCQDVISKHSARPAVDQINLMNIVIFNYLIGNADAHGKNFSLLYKGKKPQLAPAYDLLSTAVYPDLSKRMAMKIGKKYEPDEVYIKHWHRIVPDTKAARDNLERQLRSLSKNTLDQAYALKENLKKDNISAPIFDDICQVIRERAERIISQLGLDHRKMW